MRDTSPAIEQQFRHLIMARSPLERLRMAAGMHEAARALVLASFPPGLSCTENRRRLFERFYRDLAFSQVPPDLRRDHGP